jgi:hypothetical protein
MEHMARSVFANRAGNINSSLSILSDESCVNSPFVTFLFSRRVSSDCIVLMFHNLAFKEVYLPSATVETPSGVTFSRGSLIETPQKLCCTE